MENLAQAIKRLKQRDNWSEGDTTTLLAKLIAYLFEHSSLTVEQVIAYLEQCSHELHGPQSLG